MHFGKQMTTNQQNGGFGSMDRYCKRMQILAGKRSQGIWFKFIIFILKFTYSCVFLPIFGAHFPRIHHYFAPLKPRFEICFFQKLCDYVCDLLLEESNVQPVSSPVTVCGDIHGQVLNINWSGFSVVWAGWCTKQILIFSTSHFNFQNVLFIYFIY